MNLSDLFAMIGQRFSSRKPAQHPAVLDKKKKREIRLLLDHGYLPDGIARMYQVEINQITSIQTGE